MEKVKKHLKRAKTWNMVLLVLGIISLGSNLFSIPSSLNPSKETYDMMGTYGQQAYDYVTSPLAKGLFIANIVVGIILLVCYIKANNAFKNERIVTKLPYFGYIGWKVLYFVVSTLTTPKMTVEGVDVSGFMGIFSFAVSLIVLIPAIVVIVNLFKAEPEE